MSLSDSLCGICHSVRENRTDWKIFYKDIHRTTGSLRTYGRHTIIGVLLLASSPAAWSFCKPGEPSRIGNYAVNQMLLG